MRLVRESVRWSDGPRVELHRGDTVREIRLSSTMSPAPHSGPMAPSPATSMVLREMVTWSVFTP